MKFGIMLCVGGGIMLLLDAFSICDVFGRRSGRYPAFVKGERTISILSGLALLLSPALALLGGGVWFGGVAAISLFALVGYGIVKARAGSA